MAGKDSLTSCGQNRFYKKSDGNVFFCLISALMADPDALETLKRFIHI